MLPFKASWWLSKINLWSASSGTCLHSVSYLHLGHWYYSTTFSLDHCCSRETMDPYVTGTAYVCNVDQTLFLYNTNTTLTAHWCHRLPLKRWNFQRILSWLLLVLGKGNVFTRVCHSVHSEWIGFLACITGHMTRGGFASRGSLHPGGQPNPNPWVDLPPEMGILWEYYGIQSTSRWYAYQNAFFSFLYFWYVRISF